MGQSRWIVKSFLVKRIAWNIFTNNRYGLYFVLIHDDLCGILSILFCFVACVMIDSLIDFVREKKKKRIIPLWIESLWGLVAYIWWGKWDNSTINFQINVLVDLKASLLSRFLNSNEFFFHWIENNESSILYFLKPLFI